jgi:hypothetical protein
MSIKLPNGAIIGRDLLADPNKRAWLEDRGYRPPSPGRPCEGRPHVTIQEDGRR